MTRPVATTPAAIAVSFMKIIVRISPCTSWAIEAGTSPAVITLSAARFIATLIVAWASRLGKAAEAVCEPNITPAQATGRAKPRRVRRARSNSRARTRRMLTVPTGHRSSFAASA